MDRQFHVPNIGNMVNKRIPLPSFSTFKINKVKNLQKVLPHHATNISYR